MIDRLRDRVRGRFRRRGRHRHRCADVEQGVAYPDQKVEQDVPIDPGVARTRATGGAPDGGPGPTGTHPTGTFVGRVAGEDPGYHGQTGAEARAERQDTELDAEQDAARTGRVPRREAGPGRRDDPDAPDAPDDLDDPGAGPTGRSRR